MTRTDTVVVGTLVALLALIAGLIGGPAIQLAAAPSGPSPSAALGPSFEVRPYVEGVLGHPSSVSPLTARTQADRDLVALLFPGLVRNGPDGTIVPDLAERWSVDKAGKTWTVDIRPDARWHDGSPVTADDVVFTIETLQDPAYTGPSATSWSEVSVTAVNPHQVRFTLDTPLGGFLQALTQPIAPVHLLGDLPVDALAQDPFGGLPIGSGAFAITQLSDTSASLVPAQIAEEAGSASASPSSSPDSLSTATPTSRPQRPMPYLAGIEFRFYDNPTDLAGDFESGELDAASGLPPVPPLLWRSDYRSKPTPPLTDLLATTSLASFSTRAHSSGFAHPKVSLALMVTTFGITAPPRTCRDRLEICWRRMTESIGLPPRPVYIDSTLAT